MSSLKDLASLIMIPSLYKDGELHTVKPLADEDVIVHPDATDNNDGFDGSTPSTSGNFTFSRGSNLAATRVDVNGLIEKGRENLLLQSNQFDTTWATLSASVTSGQSGYDGSNDAWLLSKSAANGRVQQSKSGTGVYTFSVYAKAGEDNWCTLIADFVSGTDVIVWFDLQNGVVGTEAGSPIESKITSVGSGWYKISIAFNCPASLQTLRIYVADGDNNNGGTSGSIYIQDAQLEQGLVATDYIETGASTAQAGILEDMPRLDYSASCPALLLEPQRTNKVASSEFIKSSTLGWAIENGAVITNNYAISPEGVQNAMRAQLDNSGSHILTRFWTSFTPDASNDTASFYAKSNTGSSFDIVIYFRDVGFGTGRGSKTITLTNEWQRFDFTADCSGATGDVMFLIYNTSASENWDFLMYGAQVESGSYPTSYIPTYGTSQTRSIDDCKEYNVESLLGTDSGTIFVDFEIFNTDNFGGIVEIINDSNTTQRLLIWVDSGQDLELNISSGIGGQSIEVSDISIGRHKAAFTYSANEIGYFVDGVKIGTATPTLQAFAFSRYDMRNSQGGVNIQKKYINQTMAFPTALTDSECIALTTL